MTIMMSALNSTIRREDVTDGQRNPLSSVIHALHVHVRSEHRNLAVCIPVRLETLEELLRIMEDRSTRVETERSIYELLPTQWDGLRDGSESRTGLDLRRPPSGGSRPRDTQHVVCLIVFRSCTASNGDDMLSVQKYDRILSWTHSEAVLAYQCGSLADGTPA